MIDGNKYQDLDLLNDLRLEKTTATWSTKEGGNITRGKVYDIVDKQHGIAKALIWTYDIITKLHEDLVLYNLCIYGE